MPFPNPANIEGPKLRCVGWSLVLFVGGSIATIASFRLFNAVTNRDSPPTRVIYDGNWGCFPDLLICNNFGGKWAYFAAEADDSTRIDGKINASAAVGPWRQPCVEFSTSVVQPIFAKDTLKKSSGLNLAVSASFEMPSQDEPKTPTWPLQWFVRSRHDRMTSQWQYMSSVPMDSINEVELRKEFFGWDFGFSVEGQTHVSHSVMASWTVTRKQIASYKGQSCGIAHTPIQGGVVPEGDWIDDRRRHQICLVVWSLTPSVKRVYKLGPIPHILTIFSSVGGMVSISGAALAVCFIKKYSQSKIHKVYEALTIRGVEKEIGHPVDEQLLDAHT